MSKRKVTILAGSTLLSSRFHAERLMPTPDEDKIPTAEPSADATADEDVIGAESSAAGDGASEVLMRLRLLGKLIIPPEQP